MSARAALAAALALCLGGCGAPAADLFAVSRTPVRGGGAQVAGQARLVLHDDGTVSCGAGRRALSGALLLQARQLQRDLAPVARRGLTLAPGPRPVYAYSVQTPAGHVRFDDDSPGQPAVLRQLAFLTLEILQQSCAASTAR